MTRPGALESKKRCHDLIHRESDERDFLRISTHFPEDTKISLLDFSDGHGYIVDLT
jgi:hypothetical protein